MVFTCLNLKPETPPLLCLTG